MLMDTKGFVWRYNRFTGSLEKSFQRNFSWEWSLLCQRPFPFNNNTVEVKQARGFKSLKGGTRSTKSLKRKTRASKAKVMIHDK